MRGETRRIEAQGDNFGHDLHRTCPKRNSEVLISSGSSFNEFGYKRLTLENWLTVDPAWSGVAMSCSRSDPSEAWVHDLLMPGRAANDRCQSYVGTPYRQQSISDFDKNVSRASRSKSVIAKCWNSITMPVCVTTSAL
jgi:hypothetical protein